MATAPHTISQHENHATPSTDDKITLQTSDYEEPNIEKGEVREVFQSNVDGVEFRTVSWQQACVLFVKFNFAMSILSIPGALAALGSVGGGLCIVGFTSLNTYTALVLGDFKHNHPEFHTLADMLGHIWGQTGREIVGAMIIIAQVLVSAAGIVTTATAFNALSDHSACTVIFALASTILITLCSSIRTFSRLAGTGRLIARTSASVLAGADGIQSGVRKHVLELVYPSQVKPVYADAYCYRAVIPISEADEIMGDLTDVAKFYFGHDRSAVSYRITGGKEFNFLLCVADRKPWKPENAVTARVTREAMMADFEGDGVDERFRQLLSKANPIKWGFFHHPQTSIYYRGRVVLLGDSAHASLPFQAAGAAQGLEDALVLSNVLAELAKLPTSNDADTTAHIEAGFEAYDSVRRPRAQKQSEQSAELARMIFFQHAKVGDDMSKILSRLQRGRFNWIWFHDVDEDVEKAIDRMRANRR